MNMDLGEMTINFACTDLWILDKVCLIRTAKYIYLPFGGLYAIMVGFRRM